MFYTKKWWKGGDVPIFISSSSSVAASLLYIKLIYLLGFKFPFSTPSLKNLRVDILALASMLLYKLCLSLYMKRAARTTAHAAIETVAVDAPPSASALIAAASVETVGS